MQHVLLFASSETPCKMRPLRRLGTGNPAQAAGSMRNCMLKNQPYHPTGLARQHKREEHGQVTQPASRSCCQEHERQARVSVSTEQTGSSKQRDRLELSQTQRCQLGRLPCSYVRQKPGAEAGCVGRKKLRRVPASFQAVMHDVRQTEPAACIFEPNDMRRQLLVQTKATWKVACFGRLWLRCCLHSMLHRVISRQVTRHPKPEPYLPRQHPSRVDASGIWRNLPTSQRQHESATPACLQQSALPASCCCQAGMKKLRRRRVRALSVFTQTHKTSACFQRI